MPDEKSLDNLFYTEKTQNKTFMGLKSWQAGALKCSRQQPLKRPPPLLNI